MGIYDKDIRNAVEVLKKGGVILYPTDTVWGIGCDATNPEAVARVYEIKKRSDSKAMICLVDSDARLQRYVRNVPNVAWDLFEFATKPTTLILDGAVNLAPNLIADDGSVSILAANKDVLEEVKRKIQFYTAEAEIGKIYRGVVKTVKDFGAFVEILPGQDGLLHISEMANYRVQNVTDICKEGDVVSVKVVDIDRSGKIRLSRKAALEELDGKKQ